MYYELQRLLTRGERIVVTGLAACGKTTMLSQFASKFDVYRNADFYSTQSIHDSRIWKNYKLFDRNPWIDRYVYLYKTDDALDLCIKGYIENLPDTYILLTLNDKFKIKRDGWAFDEDVRRNMVVRFLKIVRGIWETGKIKGVIVSTPKSFRSTDFCTDERFWDMCLEETVTYEERNV